jgi:2-(1,2-epoxy-1,2-dihydrophenyl)acetyl-CoA isomerase
MTASDTSGLVERRDALAVVTLNRPGRRNGVTIEMCEQLYEILLSLASGNARVA